MGHRQPGALQPRRHNLHVYRRAEAAGRGLPYHNGPAGTAAVQPRRERESQPDGSGHRDDRLPHRGVPASQGEAHELGLARALPKDDRGMTPSRLLARTTPCPLASCYCYTYCSATLKLLYIIRWPGRVLRC